jgi:hypothetical protein
MSNSRLPSDTHPDIERRLLDAYRQMTPAQKMRSVKAMHRAAREAIRGEVRQRYPHASEEERALRVASRFLDAETMLRVYGWDCQGNERI